MISLQLEMNKQGERQVKLKNSQQLNKDKMEICAKKLKTDKSNSMEKKNRPTNWTNLYESSITKLYWEGSRGCKCPRAPRSIFQKPFD